MATTNVATEPTLTTPTASDDLNGVHAHAHSTRQTETLTTAATATTQRVDDNINVIGLEKVMHLSQKKTQKKLNFLLLFNLIELLGSPGAPAKHTHNHKHSSTICINLLHLIFVSVLFVNIFLLFELLI